MDTLNSYHIVLQIVMAYKPPPTYTLESVPTLLLVYAGGGTSLLPLVLASPDTRYGGAAPAGREDTKAVRYVSFCRTMSETYANASINCSVSVLGGSCGGAGSVLAAGTADSNEVVAAGDELAAELDAAGCVPADVPLFEGLSAVEDDAPVGIESVVLFT